MDQIKIGRFIAEIRKSVGLTQMKLAEKLCLDTSPRQDDNSSFLEFKFEKFSTLYCKVF